MFTEVHDSVKSLCHPHTEVQYDLALVKGYLVYTFGHSYCFAFGLDLGLGTVKICTFCTPILIVGKIKNSMQCSLEKVFTGKLINKVELEVRKGISNYHINFGNLFCMNQNFTMWWKSFVVSVSRNGVILELVLR